VQWNGYGAWRSDATTLGAVLSNPTGELCRDKRRLVGLALRLRPAGERVRADLVADPTTAPRTSCPGPSLAAGAGALEVLASGEVPRSALRRDRVTLRLTRGRPLETDGWAGETRADVTVVIRRTSVKVERF
jgi:hypothetical protein